MFLNAEDKKHVSVERGIGVFPLSRIEGGKIEDVGHWPTEKGQRKFSANLAGWRGSVAKVAAEGWKTEKFGEFPIPIANRVKEIDDGYAVFTDYFPGFVSLGKDGPKWVIHQLDTSKVTPDDLRRVVRILDAIHPTTKTYLEKRGQEAPIESWANEKNPQCGLRGREWFINEKTNNDRLHELWGKIDAAPEIFSAVDPEFDFKKGLETFIRNNLPLYRKQDGTIDDPADEKYLGEDVVAHGTIFADNMGIKRDSKGKLHLGLFGGDRMQLIARRGQMIDAMVSGCANNSDYQDVIIEEFRTIQVEKGRDVEKEMRAAGMHINYRCLSEIPEYVKAGKIREAQNLARLSLKIMKGEGIWKGVNTDIMEVID